MSTTSIGERIRNAHRSIPTVEIRERHEDAGYRIHFADKLKATAEARRKLEELADLKRAAE